MKKSHYLSLLLAWCVILSAVFSPISYATEAETTEADTPITGSFSYDYIDSTASALTNNYYDLGYGATTVNSGDELSFYFSVPYSSYSASGTNRYPVIIFSTPVSVPEGNSFGFTMSGVTLSLSILQGSSQYVYEYDFKKSDCVGNVIKVVYADGTFDLIKDYDLVSDGNMLTFSYSSDSARANVTSIEFNAYFNIGSVFNTYGSSATYFVDVKSDACIITHSGSLSDDAQIDGIIEWLKSIFQSIKEIPDKIGVWIQNVINTIKELPNAIIEGIKGLFIPSEESMQEIKDKFDLLMQDRFGALYQAADIISDFAENFRYSGRKTVLEVPTVSINLAGVNVSFGGWRVNAIPAKFSTIVNDYLKPIIGIVATFVFVIMLRNKFDKIVGDNT